MIPNAERAGLRRGITLTEILISILILGVGLVSLATLFPIGLLRLREAQRQTRSAYLYESAAADVAARGLLNPSSFAYADFLNGTTYTNWYYSQVEKRDRGYDPLTQDTPAYGTDAFAINNPGPPTTYTSVGATSPASGGYGLPFAYDPLWRWQTDHANGGIYLSTRTTRTTTRPPALPPRPGSRPATPCVRSCPPITTAMAHPAPMVSSGSRTSTVRAITTPRARTFSQSCPPRISSPTSLSRPRTSSGRRRPNTNNVYTIGGVPAGTPVTSPPQPGRARPEYSCRPWGSRTSDWRFSWMLTVQQNNASNGASFDGNIVVFENRPFSLDQISVNGTTFTRPPARPWSRASSATARTCSPPRATAYGYGAGPTGRCSSAGTGRPRRTPSSRSATSSPT